MTTQQIDHLLCQDSLLRANIEVVRTTPPLMRTVRNNKSAVTRRKEYRSRLSTEKAMQRASKSAYMREYMREYRARKSREVRFAEKRRHHSKIGSDIEQEMDKTTITKVRASTSIEPLERTENRRAIQAVRKEVNQSKVVSEANKKADTSSTSEKWAKEKRSAAITINVDSDENEDDDTTIINGNRLVEMLVRTKKEQNVTMDVNAAIKKIENLLQTSVEANEVVRPPASYDWIGQLVKTQLDYLEDPVIRNDTIWAIQCALRKGIERQEAKNTLNNVNYRKEPIYEADSNLHYTEDTDSQSDPSIPEITKSLSIDMMNIPLNIKGESI